MPAGTNFRSRIRAIEEKYLSESRAVLITQDGASAQIGVWSAARRFDAVIRAEIFYEC